MDNLEITTLIRITVARKTIQKLPGDLTSRRDLDHLKLRMVSPAHATIGYLGVFWKDTSPARGRVAFRLRRFFLMASWVMSTPRLYFTSTVTQLQHTFKSRVML